MPRLHGDDDRTLRLVWPQWQGAGTASVRELFSEIPFEEARRGYAMGTAVLEAILPAHDGPTETVPPEQDDTGLASRDGIEAKDAVISQLERALEAIRAHDPGRILTLGGDCATSVAPFSWLAGRYGEDLAIVWIDSHPDVGLPGGSYPGFHAMALAVLTGHGDPDILARLPAKVDPRRVGIAGMHAWNDDEPPNLSAWGIRAYAPDDLRDDSAALLAWLASTGCSRVAIHFDVDVIDRDEAVFGLGAETGGLTSDQARRIVADVSAAADVVGLTIAEFVPRQVIRLQRILHGFPLTSTPLP
jgi:arginase